MLTFLQKVGRSLILPISILPAAGILLALGDRFGIDLLKNAGGVLFDNLPLLFAIGVAIGFTEESGIAALASVVSILIIATISGLRANVTLEMAQNGGAYTLLMGIPTLQTGVFIGIIAGSVASVCYKYFYNIRLPQFLGFFSGKRFVPISSSFFSFLIGIILPIFWVWIQHGISSLSSIVNGGNQVISTFLFGIGERALIPIGLHHIFYSPFWFNFGEYITETGSIINGDQTIWFKMFEDGVKTFSTDTYMNAGKFLQGEYPLMLFGLPAAALAMYSEAKPENKKVAGGLLFSAALTCFITGITEPIEFTFIFISPILYLFNVIMAGICYSAMYILNVHIAKSFSAGLIDYVSFGILPSFSGFQTNYLNVILFGIPLALVYYFSFRFLIIKLNLATPGREVSSNINNDTAIAKKKNKASADFAELAKEYMQTIGGKENIENLTNCITRLRITLKDVNNIDEAKMKELGAKGVVKIKNSIQIIIGSEVEFLADEMKKLLK